MCVQGPISIERPFFQGIWIPEINIRRSRDRLNSDMVNLLLTRWHLHIVTPPWTHTYYLYTLYKNIPQSYMYNKSIYTILFRNRMLKHIDFYLIWNKLCTSIGHHCIHFEHDLNYRYPLWWNELKCSVWWNDIVVYVQLTCFSSLNSNYQGHSQV